MDMHKRELFGKQIGLHLGVIPFILCLITCVLLLTSFKTQQRMHWMPHRDPSTEAHSKAVKVLVSFITLLSLNFVGTGHTNIKCDRCLKKNKLLFIFGMTTTVLHLWGHLLILILGFQEAQASLFEGTEAIKVWGKRETSQNSLAGLLGKMDIPIK